LAHPTIFAVILHIGYEIGESDDFFLCMLRKEASIQSLTFKLNGRVFQTAVVQELGKRFRLNFISFFL